jgi:sporadic carbohydrate cluster protein (TIGR04323 family)
LVLEGIAVDTSPFEGILMCSMYMLPSNFVRRADLLRKILQQGTPIHFVFEDIVINSFNDINLIEDSLKTAALLPFCPTVESKEILDFHY